MADDALALLDLLAGEVSLKVLLIQAILIGDAIVLLHLGNYLVEPLDFRIFRLHIIDRRFLGLIIVLRFLLGGLHLLFRYVLRETRKERILLFNRHLLGLGPSPAQLLIRWIVASMEISVIRIESRKHVQQPLDIRLVRMGNVQLVDPLKELHLFLGGLKRPIVHLFQESQPPLLLFLKLLLHCFDYETFERGLRARPESYLLIPRDVQLALLGLLDILHRVDGAVEVPHVETIPHIGLKSLLLRQFLHFFNLMCFL